MPLPGVPSGAGFVDPRELSTPSLVILGLGVLLFAIMLFGITGRMATYLATLWMAFVVLVRLRPAGGGQLVAVVHWARFSTDADLNPSLVVMAIELLAVVLFFGGAVGIVGFGVVAGDPLLGPAALFAVFAAGFLWLLAWFLEGLSVTASNPYREG